MKRPNPNPNRIVLGQGYEKARKLEFDQDEAGIDMLLMRLVGGTAEEGRD